jgi:hypothetical protein
MVTGFLGAGGGFLIIPALLFFTNISLKQAVGTSLLIIAFNSLLGFIGDVVMKVVIDYLFIFQIAALAAIGIIIGTMQCHGVLDRLLPSYERLQEWEILGSSDGRSVTAFVTGQPGYVAVVTLPETRTVTDADTRQSILSYGVVCRGHAVAICEALWIIIFGRGGDANANARMPEELGALWGYEGNETTMDGVGNIDNDDEWVGLPAAIQRSTEIR